MPMYKMRLLPNWKFDLLAAVVLSFMTTTAATIRRPGADDIGFRDNWVTSDNHLFDTDPSQQPRAALVAHIQEDQVFEMVDTMQRLEKAFNGRYKYDWIIFSNDELTDESMSIISNATAGNIFHELPVAAQHHQNKVLPYKKTTSRHDRREPRGVGFRAVNNDSILNKYPNGWNSELFASEARLCDYDWFWKVQPGSQFPEHIDFDIFRALRDHQVVYGLSTAIPNRAARSREQEPKLPAQGSQGDQDVIATALPFLLEHGDQSTADTVENRHIPQISIENPSVSVSFAENSPVTASEDAANPPHRLPTSAGMELAGLSSNGVLEKLFDICVPGSNFEMGSLGFLRGVGFGQHHEKLDATGHNQYNSLQGTKAHKLGTGVSGQDFYGHDGLEKTDLMEVPDPGHRDINGFPDPTQTLGSDQETGLDTADRDFRFFVILGDPGQQLSTKHKKWERITNDFARQALIPGLLSGNTVIDERNFMKLMEDLPTAIPANLAQNGLI